MEKKIQQQKKLKCKKIECYYILCSSAHRKSHKTPKIKTEAEVSIDA